MDADVVIALILIVVAIVGIVVAAKRGESLSCANCPERRDAERANTPATLDTSRPR